MTTAGNVFIRHIDDKTIVCGVFPKLSALESENLYTATVKETENNVGIVLFNETKKEVPEARGNDISGILQSTIWRTSQL